MIEITYEESADNSLDNNIEADKEEDVDEKLKKVNQLKVGYLKTCVLDNGAGMNQK